MNRRGRLSRDVTIDMTGNKTVSGKKKWNMAGCVCATSIIAICLAIAGTVIAIFAYVDVGYLTNAESLTTSQPIRPTPYAFHLDSSAAPLAMSLPNDLSAYVGRVYAIYSRTDQPHTVTIDSGTLATTWDGVNKVATFGGAKGDGLTFRVLAKDLVVVLQTKNIAFS